VKRARKVIESHTNPGVRKGKALTNLFRARLLHLRAKPLREWYLRAQ